MKRSYAAAFAASLLSSSLALSPWVAASNAPPSFAHHSGHGHPGDGSLELPATRFRVGSLNKVMTATALLSLAEEHRLPLRAPVTCFPPGLSLPGEPGWTERLTPHLLLSHQGALFDRLNVVAEDAAGVPYREVMRWRVFRPLGMTRAVFLPSEVLADNDFAYGVRGATVFAPGDYDNAIERPAGFAWTSVDDLAKFSLFLLRGNRAALSDRMWRVLQSPKVNTYQFLDRQSYAYGLLVQNGVFLPDSNGQIQFYDGVKLVGHDGGIPGYKSLMMTLPRQGFGYAAVVNSDTPVPATDLIPCYQVPAAEVVGDRLPAPSPAPEPQIQRDRFGDYVGSFLDRTGIGGHYVLSLAPNGDLLIQLPEFPNFRYNPVLQPTTRDNFLFFTQAGVIPITGFRGKGSAVLHLRTRPFVWTREEGATALRSAAAPANVANEEEFTKAVSAAALEQDGSLRWTTR